MESGHCAVSDVAKFGGRSGWFEERVQVRTAVFVGVFDSGP